MFKELMLEENIELYTSYYDRAKYKSIYQHPEYLLAAQASEDYKIYLYIYTQKETFVILPSVKRKINDIKVFQDLETEYYDLKTPHEYSGVIANEYVEAYIELFYRDLGQYCKDNNIIFSFIRFNPYSDEWLLAKEYHVSKSADQIWIDCSREKISDEYKQVLKRNITNVHKYGLVCTEVEKNDKNNNKFCQLYRDAMDRLLAKKFFYFSNVYFQRLFRSKITKLFFVTNLEQDEVLSAAIILLDSFNGTAYYHLGCRRNGELVRGTMEFLLSEFSEQLKEDGYTKIHLGGGATEGLLRFKEKFSRQRVAYYTGYGVFNEKVYKELCNRFCEIEPNHSHDSFLPLYRCLE